MEGKTPARGKVFVEQEECKGCGVCVSACPPKCLELLPDLNAYGVHAAHYTGDNCTACGICFYVCPEPGAITVYRRVTAKPAVLAPDAEGPHAATL